MMRYTVIFPAAGRSTRFGEPNDKKPFAMLAGLPLWLQTITRFVRRPEIERLILVISPEDREYYERNFSEELRTFSITLIDGGKERFDSVKLGLSAVLPGCEMVAIHDIARPCVAREWINDVFSAAERTGAALLASPLYGTIKRGITVDDGIKIRETVSRENLWQAQTPQVFRNEWIMEAYEKRGDFHATDDAQLIERSGRAVTIVPCEWLNIKITTLSDLPLAEKIFELLK